MEATQIQPQPQPEPQSAGSINEHLLNVDPQPTNTIPVGYQLPQQSDNVHKSRSFFKAILARKKHNVPQGVQPTSAQTQTTSTDFSDAHTSGVRHYFHLPVFRRSQERQQGQDPVSI